LSLDNEQASLGPLAVAVEAFAEIHEWSADVKLHVGLVLEELVQNIVSYGYPDGRPGRIDVTLRQGSHRIGLTVEDDGDAFDPFSQPDPDFTLDLEDRPIGGLGIHLIRKLMDRHAYRRVDGHNRVDLEKFLLPEAVPD
jgi:serine/threonine-protein kinase RsbW